jgi:hypothetical protein
MLVRIRITVFVGILKVNDLDPVSYPGPDPLVRDIDPRIQIRIYTKMFMDPQHFQKHMYPTELDLSRQH